MTDTFSDTHLEHITFMQEDPEVSCSWSPCTKVAVWVLVLSCGCEDVFCDPCRVKTDEWLERHSWEKGFTYKCQKHETIAPSSEWKRL